MQFEHELVQKIDLELDFMAQQNYGKQSKDVTYIGKQKSKVVTLFKFNMFLQISKNIF